MTLIWTRINAALLILVLFALLAVIGLLAADVQGGPLDPPGAPTSTDSVRLPGTPISSVPYVISAPGRYYLTRNLHQGTMSGDAIAIAQNVKDVTLDLGGFTLSGSNGGVGIRALGPTPPSQYPLQIINGYVRNFGVGVDVGSAAHVRIDGMHVFGSQQSGFIIGNHSVVTNCTAALNGTNGMLIAGAMATVHDCMFLDNAQTGILLTGGSNLVESSQIYRNGTGIRFSSHENVARGNDILYSPFPGVDVLIDSGRSANRVHSGALCKWTNNGNSTNLLFNNLSGDLSGCIP